MSISRRRFVKTFAFGTAASSLLGKPWHATLLADCVPAPGPQTATLKIRISDYPALPEPFGSVRLGVNPVRQEDEPFPDGDFYPFLINRGEEGQFYVLSSECQHASCVVPAYDDFFLGIHCPCHGSAYAIDGSIVAGPTMRPLIKYDFEFDGDDTLTIHVPGLGFSVCTSVVSSQPNSRIALTFDTHISVQYEVRFRQGIKDPWTVVPFASSVGGPADQVVLNAIGATETVYVVRTTPKGFYAVSMVLNEV